jgi:hypothetical protein
MLRSSTIASLAVCLVWILLPAPAPAATAPQAFLYEAVENLTQDLTATTPRLSHWAAQGSAVAGSPFCPNELIKKLQKMKLVSGTPTSCTITAFGHDEIDPTFTGTVEVPDFAVVINSDNVVDAPEGVVMTGGITGDLVIVPFGPQGVTPDLNHKKAVLGPSVPLILVRHAVFTPNPFFGVSPGPSCFTGTFRLPFRVTSAGMRDKPVRDGQAFYLADDGSLIQVQPEEFAFGFPMLRAEVTFVRCPAP